MKKFKKTLFLSLGTLSILFFLLCLYYSHIGVSWLWLWPLFSVFCFARFLMLHFKVKVPGWIKAVYTAGVSCFLLLFLCVETQIVWAKTIEPEQNLDYIITLGAAVRNGLPTSPLLLRIEKTAEYLKENPDTIVIASGGKGKTERMSEAECIRKYLISEFGINENRILTEDRSTDTEQNISHSFSMIPDGASVGVVTSDFHIYRAVRSAEILGYDVCGIPAKSLLPLGIHYTVREFFAVVELELKYMFHLLN